MTVERRTFSADDILQLVAEVDSFAASVDDEAGERIHIAAAILRYFARGLTGPITVASYTISLKPPK
jgi:hypothetical protein